MLGILVYSQVNGVTVELKNREEVAASIHRLHCEYGIPVCREFGFRYVCYFSSGLAATNKAVGHLLAWQNCRNLSKYVLGLIIPFLDCECTDEAPVSKFSLGKCVGGEYDESLEALSGWGLFTCELCIFGTFLTRLLTRMHPCLKR